MKTLIFGAGASIPFFDPILSTSFLTEKIYNKEEWEEVISKYKSLKGDKYVLADTELVFKILSAIKRFRPEANFEEIAEVIDKIGSYGNDSVPAHNMFNTIIGVMNTGFIPSQPFPFGSELTAVPFLLREIIAKSIIDLQNNHQSKEHDIFLSLQRDFISDICQKDDNVNIMSLNYDECVLKSLEGLGFEKGFKRKDERYLMQLDIVSFMNAKKVIYFPHGNLRFQFTDNDNVTYWNDANVAEHERWEGLRQGCVGSTLTYLGGKFAYNYNTFISTGQTKEDGLNHLPYSIYYQRFGSDIFNSDTIYIIGYSFGDEHINRMLRSFIELSQKNKIFIIDYYTKEVTGTEEYKDQKNFITRLYSVFGPDWGVMYNRDTQQTEPINPVEIQKINSQGYGEIFKQITLYKKGYSEFLREYKNVI